MTDPKHPLKVFLSYASQDRPLVRELSRRLVGEGWIDTWQDEKNLLPGHDWRIKIEEAVEDADVIIICLSNQSITKEGYVQKELRYAREIALEKPEDAIFLIPLRLDSCEVPRGLRFYQWVDYFGEEKNTSYATLVSSLRIRYEQKRKNEEEYKGWVKNNPTILSEKKGFALETVTKDNKYRFQRLFFVFLVLSIFLVFVLSQFSAYFLTPEVSPTITESASPTFTSTATITKIPPTSTATNINLTATPTLTAKPEFTNCAYVVQQNDSAYGIANRFGVNISSIKDLNGNDLTNLELLRINQEVLILEVSTSVCIKNNGYEQGNYVTRTPGVSSFASAVATTPVDYVNLLYVEPGFGSILDDQSIIKVGVYYNLNSASAARLIVWFNGYLDSNCQTWDDQSHGYSPFEAVKLVELGNGNIYFEIPTNNLMNVYASTSYIGISGVGLLADVNGNGYDSTIGTTSNENSVLFCFSFSNN